MKKMVTTIILFGNIAIFGMNNQQSEKYDFQLPASMLGPRGDFTQTFEPDKYLLEDLQSIAENITTIEQQNNFRRYLSITYSVKDLEYLVDRCTKGESISRETACHRYTKKIPDLKYSSVTAVLEKEYSSNHRGYHKILHEDKKFSHEKDKSKLLFMNPFMKNASHIERYYGILLDQRTRDIFYNNIYSDKNYSSKDLTALAVSESKNECQDDTTENDSYDLTSLSIPIVYTVSHYSSRAKKEDIQSSKLDTAEKRNFKTILDFNRALFNLDRHNNNDKKRAIDNLIKLFDKKKTVESSPNLQVPLSIDCSQEYSPSYSSISSYSPEKTPKKD